MKHNPEEIETVRTEAIAALAKSVICFICERRNSDLRREARAGVVFIVSTGEANQKKIEEI